MSAGPIPSSAIARSRGRELSFSTAPLRQTGAARHGRSLRQARAGRDERGKVRPHRIVCLARRLTLFLTVKVRYRTRGEGRWSPSSADRRRNAPNFFGAFRFSGNLLPPAPFSTIPPPIDRPPPPADSHSPGLPQGRGFYFVGYPASSTFSAAGWPAAGDRAAREGSCVLVVQHTFFLASARRPTQSPVKEIKG
jgi:hypothetical protein